MKSKYTDMELAYFVSWYERLAQTLFNDGLTELSDDVQMAANIIETLLNERNEQ